MLPRASFVLYSLPPTRGYNGGRWAEYLPIISYGHCWELESLVLEQKVFVHVSYRRKGQSEKSRLSALFPSDFNR